MRRVAGRRNFRHGLMQGSEAGGSPGAPTVSEARVTHSTRHTAGPTCSCDAVANGTYTSNIDYYALQLLERYMTWQPLLAFEPFATPALGCTGAH